MCLYFEPIAVLALNQSLPCQHTNLRAIKKEELHPVYCVESGQDEAKMKLCLSRQVFVFRQLNSPNQCNVCCKKNCFCKEPIKKKARGFCIIFSIGKSTSRVCECAQKVVYGFQSVKKMHFQIFPEVVGMGGCRHLPMLLAPFLLLLLGDNIFDKHWKVCKHHWSKRRAAITNTVATINYRWLEGIN